MKPLTQEEVLRIARKQFAGYAEQHHAKGTPESHEKALVNERMCRLIDQVLPSQMTEGEALTAEVDRITATDPNT